MDRQKEKDDKSPWLHAFFDPLAGLRTVTSCVRLADLNGDGDSKLCVCDLDQKLKVFKGTSLFAEYALLDAPVAMCAVFTELASVRVVVMVEVTCACLPSPHNQFPVPPPPFFSSRHVFHPSHGYRR
jgi:hypothetical protein